MKLNENGIGFVLHFIDSIETCREFRNIYATLFFCEHAFKLLAMTDTHITQKVLCAAFDTINIFY